MPIEIIEITLAQRDVIIGIEEGHFADVKAIEITPAKLTRTISAFVNANGGELYVGIGEMDGDNDKKHFWRGFENQEAANGHIQPFEKLFPLGQYFSYTFLRAPYS